MISASRAGFRYRRPAAFSLFALLTLAACAQEDARPDSAPVKTGMDVPFSPPENGLLSEDQVRGFLLAHQALLRINDLYLDSLVEASSPARRRSLQQALDLGRDVAARKFGLNGYAEYRWILEVAPRRPENVSLLERMKVMTVVP